jgi:hypothetical protein
MSAEGQGRLWPAGRWHSRSTPSSGNTQCGPALTLRAKKTSAVQSKFLRSLLGVTPSRLRNAAVMWAWDAKPDACAITLRSSVAFSRSVLARETRLASIRSSTSLNRRGRRHPGSGRGLSGGSAQDTNRSFLEHVDGSFALQFIDAITRQELAAQPLRRINRDLVDHIR